MRRRRREGREAEAAACFRHAHPASKPGGWMPSQRVIDLVSGAINTGRYRHGPLAQARLGLVDGIDEAERRGLDNTLVVSRGRLMLRALGAMDQGDSDRCITLMNEAWDLARV